MVADYEAQGLAPEMDAPFDGYSGHSAEDIAFRTGRPVISRPVLRGLPRRWWPLTGENRQRTWWALEDSNLRPQPCEGCGHLRCAGL